MEIQKKTEKKQWRKPELVVLVRSKPEEAVLGYCHTGTSDIPRSNCMASGTCSNYYES